MGKTYKLGLLGHGISFSLSPKIHLYSANILGLNCTYELFDLDAGPAESFLKRFWDEGGHGLNVTTPHKELVAKAVQSKLRSVNTLYRGQSAWETASTDGEGFARAVARTGRGLDSYTGLVILGSGGASAAILSYLQSQKAQARVHLLRRSNKKDEALSQDLAREISFYDFNVEALGDCLSQVNHSDSLLIQASSAPLKGDDLSHLLPAFESFGGDMADLVYGKPSALYEMAKKRGQTCQDGLPMLIEQARLAQELWWGESAGFDEVLAPLQAELEAKNS